MFCLFVFSQQQQAEQLATLVVFGVKDVLLFYWPGAWSCSWVSGLHGPSLVWTETRFHNYTQASRHSGGAETTYEGMWYDALLSC